MLGRYAKTQLWVLLCGGLFGPIFLIVYFAIGQEWRDSIQWMFFVGLFITAVDVLIALALASHGVKSAAKTPAMEAGGVLGLAHVTDITETGTRINEQPLVKLQLRIEGPGITPFEVQDRVIASILRLPNITARKLVVLIDPATEEYQIDWERSSLINGLLPAQFTVEQDNKTYDLSGQSGPLMEILQILKAHNIPLNRMVDVRSNPAARQQLQAVVRRTAGREAEPPAPTPAAQQAPAAALFTKPQPSIAQRLQELETLRATGAVTDAEYTAKRAQIISQI